VIVRQTIMINITKEMVLHKHVKYLLAFLVLFSGLATHSQDLWSADRFTVEKEGIIFDSQTGLEWYVGPQQDITWERAKAWTESLTVAGGHWRMPTISELRTCFKHWVKPAERSPFAMYGDPLQKNPIDPIFRANGRWVWSGELMDSRGKTYARFLYLESGGEGFNNMDKLGFNARAFAVRTRMYTISSTSPSSDLQKALVGVWEYSHNGDSKVLEFFANGKLRESIFHMAGNVKVGGYEEGSYKVIGNKHINIEIKSKKEIWEVRVIGNRLAIKKADKSEDTFTKSTTSKLPW
jgi:hypothetical protein